MRADEVDLSTGLELDLLKSGNNGVAFSNPDVRRDYLVRHVVGLALGKWDDPSAFAGVFEEAQDRTLDFGTRREVTSVVLIVCWPVITARTQSGAWAKSRG